MSHDGAATTMLKSANPINLFMGFLLPPEILPAPQIDDSVWLQVINFDAKGRSMLGFSASKP